MRLSRLFYVSASVCLAASGPLSAQQSAAPAMPDFNALMAEQRVAMSKLAWMDGEWTGTAAHFGPEGEHRVVQIERISLTGGGTARVIEGRGVSHDGAPAFAATALLGYDAFQDRYVMTAIAQGFISQPWFEATESGFNWGFESGPMKTRYEARYADNVWTETGTRVIGNGAPVRFFEVRLTRLLPGTAGDAAE